MQNSIFAPWKSVPQSKDLDIAYVWFIFQTRKCWNCSDCAAARCFCMRFRYVFHMSNTIWALWTISYEIQGGVKRNLIRTNEPTKSFDAMEVCDTFSTKHIKIRCAVKECFWRLCKYYCWYFNDLLLIIGFREGDAGTWNHVIPSTKDLPQGYHKGGIAEW